MSIIGQITGNGEYEITLPNINLSYVESVIIFITKSVTFDYSLRLGTYLNDNAAGVLWNNYDGFYGGDDLTVPEVKNNTLTLSNLKPDGSYIYVGGYACRFFNGIPYQYIVTGKI